MYIHHMSITMTRHSQAQCNKNQESFQKQTYDDQGIQIIIQRAKNYEPHSFMSSECIHSTSLDVLYILSLSLSLSWVQHKAQRDT